MNVTMETYRQHADAADMAYDAYEALCGGRAPPRVPGCSTVIRLAVRIAGGATVEQAAAREYLYRWRLAIKAPDQCIDAGTRNACVSIFGTPHPIGM